VASVHSHRAIHVTFYRTFAAFALPGRRRAASATFHTWEIAQLYSNADGTIQFVQLRETQGAAGENLLAGHTLTVTRAGGVARRSCSRATCRAQHRQPLRASSRRKATSTPRTYPQFRGGHARLRDPNQFLPTDGGTINYAGVDSVGFGPLPWTARSRSTRRVSGSYVDVTSLATLRAASTHAADARGHRRRVLQPDAAPLLHQQPAARHRRAGLGQDSRLDPHGPRVLRFRESRCGLNPVCRFYIPPQHGDSHFFSADPASARASRT
jgi:hypothetical protein